MASKHPKSNTILSDRGKQYTSTQFKEFMKKRKMEHILTSPYNPTGNRISDRINQTLALSLRNNLGKTIHLALKIAKRALNHTYHRVLGISPYEYLFKHSSLDPLQRALEIDHDKIMERQRQQTTIDNKTSNKSRLVNYIFKNNSKVYIKNTTPKSKLDSKWFGPGQIVEILNNGNTFKVLLNNNHIYVNLKNIRPY
ncbi:Pro-Pol polyprotein [Nosema granulosis]|uniref:Pro-Pol polyprotein n=1 Tax=Nosema granulosis TaxID=83296 RepID=A0A9P6GVS5_9MICR|nr:Pro-Pol polyprotein [Nosema granulosis]